MPKKPSEGAQQEAKPPSNGASRADREAAVGRRASRGRGRRARSRLAALVQHRTVGGDRTGAGAEIAARPCASTRPRSAEAARSLGEAASFGAFFRSPSARDYHSASRDGLLARRAPDCDGSRRASSASLSDDAGHETGASTLHRDATCRMKQETPGKTPSRRRARQARHRRRGGRFAARLGPPGRRAWRDG